MTNRNLWLAALLVASAIVFHAVFPRYDITVRDAAVFRVDRWTGHVEASANGNLHRAAWAAVVSAPTPTVATTVPVVGDDVTGMMKEHTAKLSDIAP